MARSKLLLEAHLKALRLPTFLREYDKLARQCAAESLDSRSFLQQLCELELLDREQRATERRIKAAKFPVTKSLDTFDFPSLPALNKKLLLELARCEFIDRRENVLALGNSGTGKTHIGLALGLAACQRGYRTRFTTAAALVNELLEARDERRLLRCQKQLAKQDLLIVDELGYVPLSKTGAELLFEVFSQRYEQGSTLVTSNLPFNEWTEVFGSERLTGALLDRLTHHVHILEMNGESFRLIQSKKKRAHSLGCPTGHSPGFRGTYRVTRNGGRVNIRTTADCTFANSNLLELTAKELVSGRWVISDSPRDYLHVAVTKEVRRYLNSQEEEQRVLQTTEGLSLEELQRPETVVLTSQTEPIEDVVEVIGKLYADDPDVNQVAMAYADRVPVASLAAHLGWPKRKTQSALRRMYRRIKKSKSAKPRGSTPLPSLRPVPARRSGQNVIVPSVPKAGGFYCAGGTARWERLDSGCHVWTHGTGNWLNVPSDKSKKS